MYYDCRRLCSTSGVDYTVWLPYTILYAVHTAACMYAIQFNHLLFLRTLWSYASVLPKVFFPLINTITVVDRLPLCWWTVHHYRGRPVTTTRPCVMGLCAPAVGAYAPVLYGAMHPYCAGLCAHTSWVYAPVLCGPMRPCFTAFSSSSA